MPPFTPEKDLSPQLLATTVVDALAAPRQPEDHPSPRERRPHSEEGPRRNEAARGEPDATEEAGAGRAAGVFVSLLLLFSLVAKLIQGQNASGQVHLC